MLSESRLQIYLPNAVYDKLRRQARGEGKSIAQVVRESLALYLGRPPGERSREAYMALDRLVGHYRDDGSGAAERHDENLGPSGRW